MSRRSKKRKQRQLVAKRKKEAAGTGHMKLDAMEQAMRGALAAKGEDLPETSSKTFKKSLQNLGRKILGGARSTKTSAHGPRPRGAHTQFLKKSDTDDVELVIGLDFGTSCTKVIIQEIATGTAYAVPFATESDQTGTYLLPTIVSLDEQDNFNLDRCGIEFRRLKENLMNIANADSRDRDEKHKALMPHTIAYLALMFREVRAWFMEQHEEDYKGRKILWRVNVGLPASGFDHPHMPMFYRSTVRRAWYLSTLDNPITAAWASKVWNMDKLPSDGIDSVLSPDAIAAFPEVVAAVQGYAKSPQRGDGMHLLVDVGATTLDVTCFRLHEFEQEDTYPIYCATVRRLGGFELFKHRSAVVTNQINTKISRFEAKMDGVTEPKDPLKIEFGLNEQERKEEDREFANKIGMAISEVIKETKGRREPNAPEWTTSLPMFLCGGASTIDLYYEALKRIDEYKGWHFSLERKELVLPQNVQVPGISPGLRQRLMVAYGLSFNQLDFGRLIPQNEIPDPEPLLTGRDESGNPYIGPEMV